MPKLWSQTIEAHRREVRDAILDATAALVAEQGPLSVTMSSIAEEAGIGRATLYKYFADVGAILLAWHARLVAEHLEQPAGIQNQGGGAGRLLEAVLEAYALISYGRLGHRGTELAAFLHQGEHVARAERRLRGMIRDLLTEGAHSGDVRGDVAPDELAGYCLHAIAAAGGSPSEDAVRRLLAVALDGLRPPR